MKKSNKARQALLQRKRTKRNASRKNAVYNPNKLWDQARAALPSAATGLTDDTTISL